MVFCSKTYVPQRSELFMHLHKLWDIVCEAGSNSVSSVQFDLMSRKYVEGALCMWLPIGVFKQSL